MWLYKNEDHEIYIMMDDFIDYVLLDGEEYTQDDAIAKIIYHE